MHQLPSKLLKRKTDPRLVTIVAILLLCFGGIVILALTAGAPNGRSVVFKALPFGVLFCAVLLAPSYFSDRGYQVGWDDEGIYVRLPGWRFEALLSREDEIAREYGRPKGFFGWFTRPPVSFMTYGDIMSIGPHANFDKRPQRPTIYVEGRANPLGLYHNLIGIDLESFARNSILDLMEVLHSKRPDVVPEGWAKQLAKRRSID